MPMSSAASRGAAAAGSSPAAAVVTSACDVVARPVIRAGSPLDALDEPVAARVQLFGRRERAAGWDLLLARGVLERAAEHVQAAVHQRLLGLFDLGLRLVGDRRPELGLADDAFLEPPVVEIRLPGVLLDL